MYEYYSGSPDSLLPASTPSIISPAQSYRWDIEYCKDNVCNSGILQRSFQLWDIECYTDNVSYCVIFCDSVLQSYRWDIIEYFKDNVSNCGIFFVIQPYSLIGGILSNIAKILFLIVVFSCPGSSIPDLGQ